MQPDDPDLIVDDAPAARRSLRIGFVTETYPPEINGVATTIARIIDELRARKHAVQLVRPRQHRFDAAAEEPRFDQVLMRGLPIPRYPGLKMGLPAKRALVRLWTARRPDIVHIATEGPLGWSALQAARRLQLPLSSDFRTNFHAYSRHYGIGWLHRPIVAYLRSFHNLAHCTMVPTEALRRTLAGCGFRNLTVLARGVDTMRFDPARRSDELRRSWGATPADLVVLHVGRLAPEKNLGLLAAAYRVMKRHNPRVKLVLVGDGPARRWLQAQCPAAHFAGMRSGADLAAHYASGDLFVFPSTTETFGNVTPEAMASGLPVLAYDYAAAAALIRSGVNGVLAPFDDAPRLLEAAAGLALDPSPLPELGRRARETASAMGWERIAEQIEASFALTIRNGTATGLDTPMPARLPPC
ncbi:MAG: glycosyltransferase family 1 protein [Burkholderiales bacterium]|jgi:glycosyltransferase involved in cell wall biosynthesis|nr:glycosyltransferase family 1 protein [Burkholderiales bacterium]